MENRLLELKWMSSVGGPLVLMERDRLEHWNGIFGGHPTEEGITDYSRACEIDDYVGLIYSNGSQILVLGQEPMYTSWLAISDFEGILVRCVWADDERQVVNVLNSMSLDQDWEDTNINIQFPTGDLVLFDSACKGESLRGALYIKILPGLYWVESAFYEPSSTVKLLLHRLTKRP